MLAPPACVDLVSEAALHASYAPVPLPRKDLLERIPDSGVFDMLRSKLIAAGLLASFLPLAAASAAEEVRYENIGGQNYMITKRVVERPMSKTEYKDVARDVYREEYVTETQEITRIVQVPVTQYQWEARWAGRWNPFSQPYLVNRLVPRTHLETRTEIVKMPVTEKVLVPDTHIQRVAETKRWIAKEEIERKVAIDPPAGSSEVSIASKPGFVGGKKVEGELPRSSRY
jgi:hypothetical protein